MSDFRLKNYLDLIRVLIQKSYNILPFNSFKKELGNKHVCLRHDVDRRPQNALKMAELEAEAKIAATYYFRSISSVFKPEIMQRISDLGHEISYHYENLSYIGKKYKAKDKKELLKSAIEDFEKNLEKFREIAPIKTICMHGSPLSKYDNRELWNVYDYRDYGIIGEPYFDIDFNEVLYLTDTGRAWNTSGGNVRDRVQSGFNYNFKSTPDIIRALENDELPDKIMLNVHPHRWFDNYFLWAKELVFQKTKNIIKLFLSSR
ncbi:hypothetical protein GF348_24430 [candidate division KSB3 bacterium]|nr:hypothetical protein [candidate division KSB3 bacterium]